MRLLDVLGRRCTLRIMWELREDRLSFRELRKRCDDVSPTSLNQRLKELREHQLVDHDEHGFGLTRWGKEVREHLLTLSKWSNNWIKSL